MSNTAQVVHHSFNAVDYTIIGIILFSTIISFFRGFIREAISLGFWLVGLLVAFKFSFRVHVFLQQWVSSPILSYLLAFLGLFLMVFIVGVVTNMLVQAMVKAAGLTFTDRVLGVFFGAARGMAVVVVALLFVSVGTFSDSPVVTESEIAPHFMPATHWVQQYLPDQMKKVSSWVKPNSYVKLPNQIFTQE